VTGDDQIKAIHRFGTRLGVTDATIAEAVSAVENRIARMSEKVEAAEVPSYSAAPMREPDKLTTRSCESV